MPTPITLTEQENEWLQNLLVYIYNTITYVQNDTEKALYDSVIGKLRTGDTL